MSFCSCVFSPFSIAITSLGEERANLSACLDLSVPSSSWGLGRAAVCDCGTPWTFPLPFFYSLGMSFEEFQDGRHGSHLRYKNGTILVILNFMSLRCIPSSSGSI